MLPKNSLVFEDNYLLVINKPAGLTVNRADSTAGLETLEDLLPFNSLPRRGIVHRLDKDTSGLILVAKTAAALTDLQAQFKQRLVAKAYVALVHGRVEPKDGSINLPVGRNPERRQRFMVIISGRPAVTRYEVKTYFEKYSLVSVYPKTGRTHQIRVHFKHLGHPLVADPFYLGEKRLKVDSSWCPRLFLHSQELSFRHPESQQLVKFEADLPDDLKTALKKITA